MSNAKLESMLKEFRRFGHDLKAEAEQLLKQARTPRGRERLKTGLKDVSQWAQKTAEDLARLVGDGVRRAEEAINSAAVKPKARPEPRREAAPAAEAKPESDAPTAVTAPDRRLTVEPASAPTPIMPSEPRVSNENALNLEAQVKAKAKPKPSSPKKPFGQGGGKSKKATKKSAGPSTKKTLGRR
jgi:hypothetical protein